MRQAKIARIYAKDPEEEALNQFMSAFSMPYSVAGAGMADLHTGYSLPIGGVIATKDYIVPAWVGYDIGCGMCAYTFTELDLRDIDENKDQIFDAIYQEIPVGFEINTEPTECNDSNLLSDLSPTGAKLAESKHYRKALGSLGGGNHFIEIGSTHYGDIWAIIHSGSRSIGHAIGKHYMTLASSDSEELITNFDAKHIDLLRYNPENYLKYRNRYLESEVVKAKPKEGNYALAVKSVEGQNYIKDMRWCLNFALSNRLHILLKLMNILSSVTKKALDYDPSRAINHSHNYAELYKGMWIHRKGATQAYEGVMGVIPGNMRDGSFIVKGKGNPESLWSSSHGAGRVISRNKARDTIDLDGFKKDMKGIKAMVNEGTITESPDVYKNIFEVMDLQKDLVEVVAHVIPLINIKADDQKGYKHL